MHQQPANPDTVRGRLHTQRRIAEQRTAQPLALPRLADSQSAEDGDGHRIGHVPAKAPGGGIGRNGAGRQCVVAGDPAILTGHEGARGAACLVLHGPAAQPVIERGHGLFERRDLRRLCHFMLQQARAEWWATSRVSPDRLPAQAGARIADMLTPMLADLDAHGPWFIKEPRLCILLPMLRPQLGRVTAV